MTNQSKLSEKVMSLTQDQKIALLGFLIGRLSDDMEFQQTLLDGIEHFSNLTFNDHGLPILKKITFSEIGEKQFSTNN